MADAVLALLVPWGLLVGCWVVIVSYGWGCGGGAAVTCDGGTSATPPIHVSRS
jgi:hypothetical protein